MASWNYIQPVEIRFGAGLINKIDEIAQELGIANGLLVADKFFMTNGLAQSRSILGQLLPVLDRSSSS